MPPKDQQYGTNQSHRTPKTRLLPAMIEYTNECIRTGSLRKARSRVGPLVPPAKGEALLDARLERILP